MSRGCCGFVLIVATAAACEDRTPGMAEDAAGRLYVHDGTRVYRVTSS